MNWKRRRNSAHHASWITGSSVYLADFLVEVPNRVENVAGVKFTREDLAD